MTGAALDIKFKYLVEDEDRHGNPRLYFRRKGSPKVRIRAAPGTEEFLQAYKDALAGKTPAERKRRNAPRGSYGWLAQQYFDSGTFKRLDEETQKQRRYHIKEFAEGEKGKSHWNDPFALLTPKHIARKLEKLSATPSVAVNRLKALRAMFKWGFKNLDEVETNPTVVVERMKYQSDGHHTWTPGEVAQYRKHHKLGTKPRLALELLLGTACRREDAPRLGRQHIHVATAPDGSTTKRLKYRQAKNEGRAPVDIDMPLPPELEEAIDATPSGNMTFLITAYGKPYTVNGFGNALKDWCRQAKLPEECTAHGLRKRRSADLVESGATSHEGMSITGHKTLAEFERYTKDADRSKLADAAIAKVAGKARL